MKKNQKDNHESNQAKQIILDVVKKYKPETTSQLIELVRGKITLAPEEITQLLIQLENENELNFTHDASSTLSKVQAYVFSNNTKWYWIVIAVSLVAASAVFVIPDNLYPAVYIRYGLGTILILFLPGYTFIKTVFPSNLPIHTSKHNMASLEGAILGLGVSLILAMTVGLILNYTPWGISLTPVNLTLLGLTIVFATVALFREYQAKTQSIKTATIS